MTAGHPAGPFGWHPEPDLVGFLDPARSREALERLGADTWAAALDFLYGEATRRPMPTGTYPELRAGFFGPTGLPAPAPREPTPSADLLADFAGRLAPNQFGSQHPGQFAYFSPPPLPVSIAGEVLAQWTNQGVDVWHAGPSAGFVEEEVVAWLRDLVGFGDDGFGTLTSGGVMANLMGLAVARDVHLARLVGSDRPPRGADLERARAYASDQAHFSIARALSILGLPASALRVLPSDDRFRLGADTLAAAVAKDRADGFVPWCVAAVSGSTNTGSVDPVGDLAGVAEREGLWLHVDAAYGGAVRLSPRDAWRVPDLQLANSVTIDPHKWFFQAYDVGALIVRRRQDLLRTFHGAPEYYRSTRPEDEPLNWYQYSMEGTRRFRALKLWLSWRHLGSDGFARLIEANLDLAAYLAERCGDGGDFEITPAAPELSVVCFRHLPGGAEDAARLDPGTLDRHQDRLQRALEVSGEGWVSTTRLRGRTWLRAGIVNYLSTREDVDRVLDALRRHASRLASDLGP